MSENEAGNGETRNKFTPRPCPICAKMSVERYRPFCSKRCADVDLQRWFTGSYAVPVVEEDRSPEDDGEH